MQKLNFVFNFKTKLKGHYAFGGHFKSIRFSNNKIALGIIQTILLLARFVKSPGRDSEKLVAAVKVEITSNRILILDRTGNRKSKS